MPGRHYLALVYRWRWLLAGFLVGSLAAATLYNGLQRPVFQATAILELNAGGTYLTTYQPALQTQYGTPGWQAAQAEILRSFPLAEKVVSGAPPELQRELAQGSTAPPWRKVIDRALAAVGRGDAPAALGNAQQAALTLQARISVAPGAPGSSMVAVNVDAFDPAAAAVAANLVIERYIEEARQSSVQTSGGARDWLSSRLGEQKDTIRDAGKNLREYEVRSGVVNLDERKALVNQRLSTLTAQLLQARVTRRALEVREKQVEALDEGQRRRSTQLRSHPAVVEALQQEQKARQDMERLGRTLGARHPDMVEAANAVRVAEVLTAAALAAAARAITNDLAAARSEEAALEQSIAATNAEMQEIKEKAVQHDLMKREAEASEQVFRGLTLRAKEAGLEGEVTAPNVRIVAPAYVPQEPVRPDRRRTYETALTFGIGAALVLILVLEQVDDTIVQPEAVRDLGVTLLATVPEIPLARSARRGTRRAPSLSDSPAMEESYRVLATNLLLAPDAAARRVVLVTSAIPGEGKSTTAAHVARALAQSGASVALIDGDLRRPTQAQRFGVPPSQGLGELLGGTARRDAVVRRTGIERLDLVAAGAVAGNTAELLGRDALPGLLADLRTRYDWLIVDSPPVLAVADTAFLCARVDSIVLVLAAQRTPRHTVKEALQRLRPYADKLSGAVLNRVDVKLSSYYYGNYYDDAYYGRRTG